MTYRRNKKTKKYSRTNQENNEGESINRSGWDKSGALRDRIITNTKYVFYKQAAIHKLYFEKLTP